MKSLGESASVVRMKLNNNRRRREPKLFNRKTSTIWRRFKDGGAKIRSVANEIVSGLKPDGILPSGQQAADLMETLHDELWKQTGKSTMTVKVKPINAGDQGLRQEGHGATLCDSGVPASRDAEKPTGDDAVGVTHEAGGPASAAGSASCETYETVDVPRPDSWVWEFILILVLYGNLAPEGDRHESLALTASSGPSGRKRKGAGNGDDDDVGSISADGNGGFGHRSSSSSPISMLESPNGIRMSGGVGETHSRAKVKAANKKDAAAKADDKNQRRVIELMEKPPDDPTQQTMLGVMEKMVTSMNEGRNHDMRKEGRAKEEATRSKRNFEIHHFKEEIALLSEMGDDFRAETTKARRDLLALMRKPVEDPVPQTPHNDTVMSVVVGDRESSGAEDNAARSSGAEMGPAEGRGSQSESVSAGGDENEFEEATHEPREHCSNQGAAAFGSGSESYVEVVGDV